MTTTTTTTAATPRRAKRFDAKRALVESWRETADSLTDENAGLPGTIPAVQRAYAKALRHCAKQLLEHHAAR
jgi:hypothetical protein